MWPVMARTIKTSTTSVTIPATTSSTTPVIPAARLIVRSGKGSPTDSGGPSTSGLPAPGLSSSFGFSCSSGVLIFLFDPRKYPVEAAARHRGFAVATLPDLVDFQRCAAVRTHLVQNAPAGRLDSDRALKRPVLGEL